MNFDILRHLHSHALLLCMILVCSSCSTAFNTTLSTSDLEDIRNYSRQYVEAMRKSDWPTVAESFTLEAVRMPPNAPTQKGRAEIENSFIPIDRVLAYDVNLEQI